MTSAFCKLAQLYNMVFHVLTEYLTHISLRYAALMLSLKEAAQYLSADLWGQKYIHVSEKGLKKGNV